MDVENYLRKIYAIMWFSWQELSNWTKPHIFIAYLMVRPIFGLLLYAYIYIAFAVTSGLVDPQRAFYLITGIAFYNFIGNGIYGVVWIIHEEREHYNILKYTYISFPKLRDYLLARSIVYYIIGIGLSIVVLLIGLPLVGYNPLLLKPNVPLLIFIFLIGFVWSAFLSIVMSGSSLFSSEFGPLISEAFGGLLFLLGNVLFPITSLPEWLQPAAYALPMMDWMELARFSINPAYPIDPVNTTIILVIKTLVYVIIGIGFFALADKLARDRGLLETSLYH
jgi:ABC-2 type transport system permease protein